MQYLQGKRHSSKDSDDYDRLAVPQHIQVQREYEQKILKVEEERLDPEKDRLDGKEKLFHRRDEKDLEIWIYKRKGFSL